MLPELSLLKHLVIDCGYTARQAAANGYFTGRSIDSRATNAALGVEATFYSNAAEERSEIVACGQHALACVSRR